MGKRLHFILACALLVATSLVTTAHAQLGQADPFATGEQTARENNLDTDQAPNPKPTEMWQLVHGTPYKKTEPVDESVTSFDTDLFTVSFRDEQLGYAAGSRCADPPEREEDESDADYGQRVSDCSPRVPVLYRFTETAEFGERWEEVELDGQEKPGYVGAIEWIDEERVLAVGGDGTYPRREVARNPGESYEEWAERDPAGMGRAWLLESGEWRELDLSEELEAGMRGMTAVGFHNLPPPEIGAAGALGQVWMWEDGEFTKRYDRESESEEMVSARLLTGRVRDLGFAARLPDTNTGPSARPTWPLAYAVTSGCCHVNEAENIPRILTFDSRIPRWYVRSLRDPRTTAAADDRRNEHDDAVNYSPWTRDSFYSLWLHGAHGIVTAVSSPGGPEADNEPPSVLTGPVSVRAEDGRTDVYRIAAVPLLTERYTDALASPELSTTRLHAADGSDQPRPDWIVGELGSTELDGLGAQAVARATHLEREQGIQAGTDENGMPFVEDTDRALHPLRSLFFRLPSYTLNAVDVVGESGWGWAVGDRGGLVRLSETGDPLQTAKTEPPAARVGKPRESELADTGPYDALRPTGADAEPGAVPPLLHQPRLALPEPRFEEAGDLGTQIVRQIVMSRDGSEGWASAGESGGSPVLYRFHDGQWRRCAATDSASGPADRACAGLEGVPGIVAMARVPLENDIYPTNDDEFEVFAIAGVSSSLILLRYSEGRWEEWEPEGTSLLRGTNQGTHIAFTAPDDGWVFKREGDNAKQRAYRFDGEKWIDCIAPDADCADPEGRFALGEKAQTSQYIQAGNNENDRAWINGVATVGERVYAFGHRRIDGNQIYPLILYRDPSGQWRSEEGGLDPAWEHTQGQGPPPDPAQLGGSVHSLAVAGLTNGGIGGWAVGHFQAARPLEGQGKSANDALNPIGTTLMHLEGEEWAPFPDHGPVHDYLNEARPGGQLTDDSRHVAIARPDGGLDSYFVAVGSGVSHPRRLYGFREDAQRFELLDTEQPRATWQVPQGAAPDNSGDALAPDGEGGFWVAAGSSFRHYTTRPREPVFKEVANPVGDGRITDLAGARDGSIWLATNRDTLYRYDRLTGWDRARIQGWDPGRVVTSPSPVSAISLTPEGEGVAVGPGGRIARLSPTGAVLDPAAGTACNLAAPAPPCTTGRDLRAVDVAPDGSAIAAGDQLALLWRPAGGDFRAISRPQAAAATDVLAVSMPSPDRAWIATSNDRIFRGELSGTDWSWRSEGVDEPVRELALDASGHGYAVGTGGLVLERSGDATWKQIPSGGIYTDLSSVALPLGGGEGALLAGAGGILTKIGESFEPARHGGGPPAGMAILPGIEDGQTEAWVAGAGELLHYTSHPEESLLRPDDRAEALPDAPPLREGEIAFAALGKTECHGTGAASECHEMHGTNETSEVISRRSIAEIAERSEREPGGLFSVFTGDATDATSPRDELVPDALMQPEGLASGQTYKASAWRGPIRLRRWREMVADRMERAGVPMLAAIGGQDLSEVKGCDAIVVGGCVTTRKPVGVGENLAWREEMAGRRVPWGEGTDPELGGEDELSFSPVRDRAAKAEPEGPTDGAQTHYALDVERDGEAVMRVVFADSSMRSLSASDPQQNPLEPAGQAAWLERVLCREPGSAASGERCTRPAELPAVVVTNTPTYSYAATPPTETMSDAAAFEAILMRHGVSAVVSGRLGWNGRYWALAPGLHEPCPGGEYQDEPPQVGRSICGETGPGSIPVPDPSEVERELDKATGAEVPQTLLPFVVASGAGGELAGTANADEGFWHGYSIVRVPADGDPRGVIVEQRPVLDWVGLETNQRVIRPRQKVLLRGHGRSPISTAISAGPPASHYEFSSAAVTHRYDLLRADPEEPWLALEDSQAGAEADGPEACGAYVCLPEDIATIDSQEGRVKAGSGKHPPTYAVAMLSVGDEVATTPLVFEPAPSFRFEAPTAPRPTPAIAAVTPPGSPTAPPTPQIPNVPLPQVASPPALVPPPPAPPATPPQPPVPPPVPPANAGPSALSLSFAPTGLVVAPTASVIPPPAPPINPAPPGGARKEARQRQAATQKSGADNAEGSGEAQNLGGDQADGPPTQANAATRHEFTAVSHPDRASDWTQGLAWGAGLTLGAFALAAGFTTLRPGSRRRTPEVAAPALSRSRTR